MRFHGKSWYYGIISDLYKWVSQFIRRTCLSKTLGEFRNIWFIIYKDDKRVSFYHLCGIQRCVRGPRVRVYEESLR